MKLIKITEDYYVNPAHVECVRVDDDEPIVYVSFNDNSELELPVFKTRDEARKFIANLVAKLNAEQET